MEPKISQEICAKNHKQQKCMRKTRRDYHDSSIKIEDVASLSLSFSFCVREAKHTDHGWMFSWDTFISRCIPANNNNSRPSIKTRFVWCCMFIQFDRVSLFLLVLYLDRRSWENLLSRCDLLVFSAQSKKQFVCLFGLENGNSHRIIIMAI